MLQKIFFSTILLAMAILLKSCCNNYSPISYLQIVMASIPAQTTITVFGIKNGKSLERLTLRRAEFSNNNLPNETSYAFAQGFDFASNESVLCVEYIDNERKIRTDTITVTYKTSAEYESGCGIYTYMSDFKLKKTSAKFPYIISVKNR
jgi:hypothetical protein